MFQHFKLLPPQPVEPIRLFRPGFLTGLPSTSSSESGNVASIAIGPDVTSHSASSEAGNGDLMRQSETSPESQGILLVNTEVQGNASITVITCKCRGKCFRGCECKKSGIHCGENCKCSAKKCVNKVRFHFISCTMGGDSRHQFCNICLKGTELTNI